MTAADRGGFAALDGCVHCGFCLQACPTFLATGDEADGPRGRIELMRSLEAGILDARDPALLHHLDRCLGCRGCEPVCPSGVGYGRGLEAARAKIAANVGVPFLARLALWLMTTPGLSRFVYAAARLVRATGIPRMLGGWGAIGFPMGMLAATKKRDSLKDSLTVAGLGIGDWSMQRQSRIPNPQSPILFFSGCIMDGLFSHVHDATTRTLEVNGYQVHSPIAQVCCGALHAHAGLRDAAAALARQNVAAFGDDDALIVVNSAGCGALLKDYGHLLDGDERAARFASRVRDVSEVLAARGPIKGGRVEQRVAYDPPCHLLHAQRVADPPLRLLEAIPGLTLVPVTEPEKCCGSAGLYTMLQPELSRAVLAPKLAHLRTAAPDVVVTGNPGCLMQIGAGLAAEHLAIAARHPVELLDDSYRAAGLYD
jgi:glycolate oxidase iron-sulfur subunit